jgi:iron complex transport system ATP-binding protein
MTGGSASPLSVRALSWGYRAALGGGLELTLQPGEAVAIVGANGAGKTTLLRTLAGQLPPLEGEVCLAGEGVVTLRPEQRARRVALLPQLISADLDLTVRELVELGRTPHLGLWGRLGVEDRRAVGEALSLCDLQELACRRLGALSGGERQRAQLALCLAQGAPLLLLDEPTAHLDLRHRHQLFQLLSRLRHQQRLTVVLVLHELADAYREGDRVLVLVDGAAVEIPADDPARREKLARAFGVPPTRIAL